MTGKVLSFAPRVVLTALVGLFLSIPAFGDAYVAPAKPATAVTLKLWLVGDKAKDMDMVLTEINKKLADKLNATLELDYISWGDFGTKYPLLFAAGESFDGIFTADWSFYGSQAAKNGFMEISPDLVKKNAPAVWANTPKAYWDQVKVKGKPFMVPQLTKEFGQRMYIIRGDLREKYKLPPIKKFADLEAYLAAVAKNEKQMVGINALGTEGVFLDELVAHWANSQWVGGNVNMKFLTFKVDDPKSSKLTPVYELPGFKAAVQNLNKWYKAGYVAKDILSQKAFSKDLFQAGQTALFVHNVGNGTVANDFFKQKQPGWKVEVYDGTEGGKVLPYPAISGGLGINAKSKNADRLLQVVDYLRYDREANYLAQRGIEGKHWKMIDPSTPNIIANGPDAANYGDSFTWGPWRSFDYQYFNDPALMAPGAAAIVKSLDTRTVNHPLQVFTIDDSKIKSEMTSIKLTWDQYMLPLLLGVVDYDKGIETLKTRLKQAGFDKVRAEYQAQADAALAESMD